MRLAARENTGPHLSSAAAKKAVWPQCLFYHTRNVSRSVDARLLLADVRLFLLGQ